MKNSVKIVLALMVSGLSVMAQDQDPKAKAILDDLSKTTKAYKTIVTEYVFTIKNKEGKQTDTQKGKIQVKGNKYKLEIPGNTIICDGKTVWTANHEAKEVTIKDYVSGGDDSMDPTKIFTLYETGFKYKYDKEETVNGQKLAVINLYPSVKPEKKKFHTVKLYVDKTKKQVKMMKMMMKDGSSQIYEVKSMTPDVELSDSIFTFDLKGYDPIDER